MTHSIKIPSPIFLPPTLIESPIGIDYLPIPLVVAPDQVWAVDPSTLYSSDKPCHLAIWRRGWSQISLQCSPGVPAADMPSTRRPRTVLGQRELPPSESSSSSSTLVSLRPSSEGRSKTKSSLKTGLGEHFFTWVFFLHTRFFPWYMFTLTYGSREGNDRADEKSKNRHMKKTGMVIYQSMLGLKGILFLSQINMAIDGEEMMDIRDEDERGWLCKTDVCVRVTECALSHPDQIIGVWSLLQQSPHLQ